MNLPQTFIERTKCLIGNDWENFAEALRQDVPVSIRINNKKYPNGASLKHYEPIPWCKEGYYLSSRPQFTYDPLFHAGCYYVQEASSMFIEQAFTQYVDSDVCVLDLCAAPGGKSTLLASLISSDSLLVSNEIIRSRSNILAENMTKWGYANTMVSNNDPVQIGKLKNAFDVILVDAPCSGEGMFRKDAGAISEWSVDNVKLCQQRQRRIITDIWDSLKPGGLMMYSTCTYNEEENEQNVQWICNEFGAETLPVKIQAEWVITSSLINGVDAYRFFPHKTKGEGFFFALLRKNAEERYKSDAGRTSKNKGRKSNVLPDMYKDYIKDKSSFMFIEENNSWIALPQAIADKMINFRQSLHVISSGVSMGEFKGKDFIPSQSLAMSLELNRSAFTQYELDWGTAINYLRKEPLMLPDTPKGYILLTYENIPIGFVKNIGNRVNNLYPQEWRIRSANIPDNEVKVL